MKYSRFSRITVTAVAAVLVLSACGDGGGSQGNGEAVPEDLRIAYNSQPPTLDPFASTANPTRDMARNAFEGLVAADSEGELHPVLAESWEEHEDGSITFVLRDDVTFHDGSEMTATDVVASLERYFDVTALGQQYFQGAAVTADDDHTVTLSPAEPMFITLTLLADGAQPALIMPAEIAENAPDGGLDVDEIIGTGPYELVDWVTDQYVHFEIFEDYVPKEGPDEGLTGDRSGTYEHIYFDLVSDDSTRVSGIQTGEYDIATAVPHDNFDQLDSDESLEMDIAEGEFIHFTFNKSEGVMADQKMRQAAFNAIDVEQVLTAALADDRFFTLNGALVAEDSPWYTDAGLEGYGEPDLELVEELLQEAGYDGEPVRIITSQEYPQHYDAAIMVEQQLTEAGINVDLIVTDWPTLLSNRDDPSAYEIHVTHAPPMSLPIRYSFFLPSWSGWTDDEGISQAISDITYASDEEEAYAGVDALQEAFYGYLPSIKFGEMTAITAIRDDVEGYEHIPGTGEIFYRVAPTEG